MTEPSGTVEAVEFASRVSAELIERAPVYSIRSVERAHFDRAILAISGLLRAVAALPTPSDQEQRISELEACLKRMIDEKAPAYHDCLDNGEAECVWCEADNLLHPERTPT